MRTGRKTAKLLALAVVVAMPLLGVSAVASAARPAAKNAVGSPKWCAAHPAKAKTVAACAALPGGGTTGGGGGGGSGGPGPGSLTIQIDPNTLVEFGASEVFAVVQVEALPSFAGDAVSIDSPQLQSSCGGEITFQTYGPSAVNRIIDSIQVVLDNDGNATVLVLGTDCAPGSSVIEADLAVAPFPTALTTLRAEPPAVTPAGVSSYPTSSGTVPGGEVETGDTPASGDSNIYAVFYVEADPVYAEQTVTISAAQLEARCLRGFVWTSPTGYNTTGSSASGTIDDDGNAVFTFMGISCAAGTSVVIAEVGAGVHTTYTGTFTVNPPAPTI
jgi:hypothetical protein